MIDVSTPEGKTELIAELRKRDAAGLIGEGKFNNDDWTPCCTYTHVEDIAGGDSFIFACEWSNGTGNWEDSPLYLVVSENDCKGPAAGITQLAKNLGVTES